MTLAVICSLLAVLISNDPAHCRDRSAHATRARQIERAVRNRLEKYSRHVAAGRHTKAAELATKAAMEFPDHPATKLMQQHGRLAARHRRGRLETRDYPVADVVLPIPRIVFYGVTPRIILTEEEEELLLNSATLPVGHRSK